MLKTKTLLGDSGGPLVANKTLYTIVSYGVGCADPQFPGVCTNVSMFSQIFINNDIQFSTRLQSNKFCNCVIQTDFNKPLDYSRLKRLEITKCCGYLSKVLIKFNV